jgi:hypothetical protein
MTGPGVKAPADYIEEVMSSVKSKNAAEPEFHQAVREVFDSLRLVLAKHPEISISPHSREDRRNRACRHVPRALV